MFTLFVYMDFLIFVKWSTNFKNVEYTAPSIITTMIEMALNGGEIAPGFVPLLGTPSC